MKFNTEEISKARIGIAVKNLLDSVPKEQTESEAFEHVLELCEKFGAQMWNDGFLMAAFQITKQCEEIWTTEEPIKLPEIEGKATPKEEVFTEGPSDAS